MAKSGNTPFSSSSDSDPESEYYFERLPLVLKNNPDYQQLLKCQLKLHCQLNVSVKNLENLLELWDYGTKHPLEFLEKIKLGNLHLPEKNEISELPNIDWIKYTPANGRGHLRSSNPSRRTRLSVSARGVASRPLSSSSPSQEQANPTHQEDVKPTVRGRVFDASKPHSFNQPWTREEQRRLDELLVTFPPEFIAANRYRKIAEELGTRTPIQVQSRLQKYSIALKKNKIALPGYKKPSWNIMRKQMGFSRRRSTPWVGKARSTFITSHDHRSWDSATDPLQHGLAAATTTTPSIKLQRWGQEEAGMDEGEDDPTISDGEDSPELRRLMALRRVRVWKSREQQPGHPPRHHTFTCCGCKQSPIIGSRYHCLDCSYIKQEVDDGSSPSTSSSQAAGLPSPGLFSIDFCSRCYAQQKADRCCIRSPKYLMHDHTHRLRQYHFMHLKDTLNRLLLTIEVNDIKPPATV